MDYHQNIGLGILHCQIIIERTLDGDSTHMEVTYKWFFVATWEWKKTIISNIRRVQTTSSSLFQLQDLEQ